MNHSCLHHSFAYEKNDPLRSTENITACDSEQHTKQILTGFSWTIPLKPHSAVLFSESLCLSDLSHDTSSLSSDPDQYPSCRAVAHLVVTSYSVCAHTWPASKSFIWSLSQHNKTVVTEKNTSAYRAGYMTLDQRKQPW